MILLTLSFWTHHHTHNEKLYYYSNIGAIFFCFLIAWNQLHIEKTTGGL